MLWGGDNNRSFQVYWNKSYILTLLPHAFRLCFLVSLIDLWQLFAYQTSQSFVILLKILSQFVIRGSVSLIMLFHTKVLVPLQSYLSRFFFDFCSCHILRNASSFNSRVIWVYSPLFFLSSFQDFFHIYFCIVCSGLLFFMYPLCNTAQKVKHLIQDHTEPCLTLVNPWSLIVRAVCQGGDL